MTRFVVEFECDITIDKIGAAKNKEYAAGVAEKTYNHTGGDGTRIAGVGMFGPYRAGSPWKPVSNQTSAAVASNHRHITAHIADTATATPSEAIRGEIDVLSEEFELAGPGRQAMSRQHHLSAISTASTDTFQTTGIR